MQNQDNPNSTGAAGLRSVQLLWLLMIALTITDAVGLRFVGLSLLAGGMVQSLIPIVVTLGLVPVTKYFKIDRRAVTVLHITGLTLSYMTITLIMSYIAAALGLPLVDDALNKADHALGLDWLAFYTWVHSHVLIHKGLSAIYSSIMVQIVLLQAIIIARGHIAGAWELLWLLVLSCVGCVVLSGVWPAVGPFGYFHVEQQTLYLNEFKSTHDGTLTVLGKTPIQGIITFPSFHTAIAIVYAYASRNTGILFPLFVAANLIMIVSVIPIGGHYFADVWGGTAVALATIGLVRMAAARKQKQAL